MYFKEVKAFIQLRFFWL